MVGWSVSRSGRFVPAIDEQLLAYPMHGRWGSVHPPDDYRSRSYVIIRYVTVFSSMTWTSLSERANPHSS